MTRFLRPLLLLAALCFALAAAPAAAQLNLGASGADLLAPEQAFRFSARVLDAQTLEVGFAIAEGYYMYRHAFRFALEGGGATLGEPDIPPGVKKRDAFFGEVETYRGNVLVRLPVEGAPGAKLRLAVTSQGCADAGVCYVPMESKATLRLVAGQTGLTGGASAGEAARGLSLAMSDFDVAALFGSGSFLWVLAAFFFFGLLLAFTPCILPMLPILTGIIAGEGAIGRGKVRALALSLAYVLGMAVMYALAGVAAAYSGGLLAAALQNAWVLGAFSLVFVALALSMFGLYELQLPGFLRHRVHATQGRLRGGRLASVAGMGALSALIVSPCVAAPLAGALLYISQSRDVLLGGSALFAMALGMGTPLVAVGVSEGALLPRSGPWMVRVRQFFGVLLLGVAIWIASPVLPGALVMTLWALLLIGAAVFMRALDRLPVDARAPARLAKAAGVALLVVGVSLLVGVLSGARDPLAPLAGLFAGPGAPSAGKPGFMRVNTPEELDRALAAPGRPVLLDFYADWCVSCKEMEAFTFSDPRVRAKMDRMLLVQVDVTANTEAHKALLRRYSLFGPPGIIFFDDHGREIRGLRVVGFQSAERFLGALERALTFRRAES